MMFLITYGQFCENASPPLRSQYIYFILLLSYLSLYIDVPVLCGTFISVNFHSQNNYVYNCILFSYRHNYCINVLPITTT